MIVKVTFTSGQVQTFLISPDMLAVEFQRLAEPLGGQIRRLEYP